MSTERWIEFCKSEHIPRGALEAGFKPEPMHDSPYLPTWDRSKAQVKVEVPIEDLSHLNDPRYKVIQKSAKKYWEKLTPEQRAEAARVRFENGRKLAGYKRGKR